MSETPVLRLLLGGYTGTSTKDGTFKFKVQYSGPHLERPFHGQVHRNQDMKSVEMGVFNFVPVDSSIVKVYVTHPEKRVQLLSIVKFR